jgi:hypothetical protein
MLLLKMLKWSFRGAGWRLWAAAAWPFLPEYFVTAVPSTQLVTATGAAHT